MRKLMLTGIVAVAGVLAFSADAQALGKRKKNKGCNSCATAAPVATGCGGCGGGMAYAGGTAGYALAPEAMPATGTATTVQPTTVIPVSGTTSGAVVTGGYTTVVEPTGTPAPARRGILRR